MKKFREQMPKYNKKIVVELGIEGYDLFTKEKLNAFVCVLKKLKKTN